MAAHPAHLGADARTHHDPVGRAGGVREAGIGAEGDAQPHLDPLPAQFRGLPLQIGILTAFQEGHLQAAGPQEPLDAALGRVLKGMRV